MVDHKALMTALHGANAVAAAAAATAAGQCMGLWCSSCLLCWAGMAHRPARRLAGALIKDMRGTLSACCSDDLTRSMTDTKQ
jgi:hypothetical protein